MRYIYTTLLAVLLLSANQAMAQRLSRKELLNQIDALTKRIEQLEGQIDNCVKKSMPIDPKWDKWQDVRYNYGFNTAEQPIFNTVNGVFESTTMFSVRGGLGRWNNSTDKPYTTFVDGGHLFEGWNKSESCRLTMLIGKQAPDIACIQVYSPKGLYRPKRHFGWVKLGSDDANEGVDFGRRWAISFVPFTLGAFDKAPTTTFYTNSQIGSDAVPVGTLYYDTKEGKVGCYTPSGWRYLKFE
ncbi:MAG: hypothetical protein IIV72_06935 [Alistipes sp.]|nr:hypothetical protein [Alistipes sp.]